MNKATNPRMRYNIRERHGISNEQRRDAWAANGMRKCFPDAFEREGAVRPDFFSCLFLKHPDAWLALANRMEQIEGNDYSHASKSRLKRERRKAGKRNVGILEAHGSKRLYVVQSDRAS
jgi:hypothetical protein